MNAISLFLSPCLRGIAVCGILLGITWTATASLTEMPPGSRPVALVGDSYGGHEVTSIIRNIFDRSDWVFEARGTFLPAEEFSKYSLVILCHSLSQPYSEADHAVIRKYLESGGRILLMNQAPRAVSESDSAPQAREWLGFDLLRIKQGDPAAMEAIADPVLEGVFTNPRPSWFAETLIATNLSPDATSLVGSEGTALVVRHQVGKGVVYFLGGELFRMRLPNTPNYEDSDAYVRLVRNVIAEAHPLTLTDWQSQMAKAWTGLKKRFLIWNREWQRGTEDGPIFVPPLPAENEIVGSLSFDLAVDEYEAVQLNLTELGAGGELTWKTDLGGLPAEALEVFVQDRPNPIPWPKEPAIAKESPFWLMPPSAVDPKGGEGVKIAQGQTRILWLKWNTHGLAPGAREGAIEFFINGTSVGRVALHLAIHAVRVPAAHRITISPAGQVYGDVNTVEPALRFKRNLRDLGFEWSLINTMRPETFRIGDGTLTVAYLKSHADEIISTAPPLDLSSMDAFIDAALEHNLTYFRLTANLTDSINSLCAKAKLTDEQTRAVRHWYCAELSRYLRDKGIRNFYVSKGDELNAEELRKDYLPWTRDLGEAGFLTTSSFSTGVVTDPALTTELASTVGAWTLNRRYLPGFLQGVKEGKIPLAKGALIGTYGAGEGRGSEIRKNASQSRMIAWEAWALGSDYCSPNPYFKSWLYYCQYSLDRGLGGERFVAFQDRDNLDAPLVNSAFVEGMRESAEEANLAWAMNWYLQKLGDRVPESLRQRAAKIVGHGDDSILKWREQPDGEEGFAIVATREQYIQAKREVLEILEALRPLASDIRPDVTWNNLPLITDGKAVATLAGSRDASSIAQAVERLSGLALPVSGTAFPSQGTVLFVGTADDPQMPPELKAAFGTLPAGSWIRETQRGAQTIVWIGGADEKALDKAIRQFGYFLRAPADVFVRSPRT